MINENMIEDLLILFIDDVCQVASVGQVKFACFFSMFCLLAHLAC